MGSWWVLWTKPQYSTGSLYFSALRKRNALFLNRLITWEEKRILNNNCHLFARWLPTNEVKKHKSKPILDSKEDNGNSLWCKSEIMKTTFLKKKIVNLLDKYCSQSLIKCFKNYEVCGLDLAAEMQFWKMNRNKILISLEKWSFDLSTEIKFHCFGTTRDPHRFQNDSPKIIQISLIYLILIINPIFHQTLHFRKFEALFIRERCHQ